MMGLQAAPLPDGTAPPPPAVAAVHHRPAAVHWHYLHLPVEINKF